MLKQFLNKADLYRTYTWEDCKKSQIWLDNNEINEYNVPYDVLKVSGIFPSETKPKRMPKPRTFKTAPPQPKRKIGEEKKYQASFVGFFPAAQPKYSCIVVINNPKKDDVYGGKVAAPIFKELADKVYASDMNMHSPIKKVNNITSLPKVKQGKTSDASLILDKIILSRLAGFANFSINK